jgi:hypothetical protein
MRSFCRFISFFAVVLFAPHGSSAQGYPLDKVNVVAGGGGSSVSGAMYLRDTVGETFVGETGNPSFGNPAGYWYMVDAMHIGPTSAVFITSFELTSSLKGVTLSWQIGHADELAGFNIYRSTQENAGFILINDALIPAGEGNEFLDRDVRPGQEYWYRLGAVDRDGEFLSAAVKVRTPPGELTLFQNHPNPFNPSTTISFYLPKPAHTTLTIYNVQGKRVKQLVDETRNFGLHEVVWDGRDERGNQTSSGVYFYRLSAGKKSITKKLTVLK